MPVSGPSKDVLYVGRRIRPPPQTADNIPAALDIESTLEHSLGMKYDFVVAQLGAFSEQEFRPLVKSDLSLASSVWSSAVVCELTAGFGAFSSEEATFAKAALARELSWAQHLGVYAAVLPAPCPHPHACAEYAAWLNRHWLKDSPTLSLSLRIPLVYSSGGSEPADSPWTDGWAVWNRFRSLLEPGIVKMLGLCLEVGDMSGENCPLSDVELDRWFGEKVQYVFLRKEAYLRNAKGFPVLSKRAQSFAKGFFVRGVHFVMDGGADGEENHAGVGERPVEQSVAGEICGGEEEALSVEEEVEVDGPSAKAGSSCLEIGAPAANSSTSPTVLRTTTPHDSDHKNPPPSAEQQRLMYLARMFQKRPPPNFRQRFEKPYHDALQLPLQPLHNHLESGTYETFEEDPIKYRLYEHAVLRRLVALLRARGEERTSSATALRRSSSTGSSVESSGQHDAAVAASGGAGSTSPVHRSPAMENSSVRISDQVLGFGDEESALEDPGVVIDELLPTEFQELCYADTEPFRLVVAGAGRGPLVQACLNAIDTLRAKVPSLPAVFVTAVEKNPNAMFTLTHRLADEWSSEAFRSKNVHVNLVGPTDMRSLTPNLLQPNADILLSELLGSFSDNELSPECLDSAIPRCLKPNGCCIPQRYWSTLQLISTPKIWNELSNRSTELKSCEQFEWGYVVALHQYFPISGTADCMMFDHGPDCVKPARLLEEVGRNERKAVVTLVAEVGGRGKQDGETVVRDALSD